MAKKKSDVRTLVEADIASQSQAIETMTDALRTHELLPSQAGVVMTMPLQNIFQMAEAQKHLLMALREGYSQTALSHIRNAASIFKQLGIDMAATKATFLEELTHISAIDNSVDAHKTRLALLAQIKLHEAAAACMESTPTSDFKISQSLQQAFHVTRERVCGF